MINLEDENEIDNKLKIVCPYCNEPFTAEMEFEMGITSNYASMGPISEGVVEIICSNCKKVIYRKHRFG